MAAVNAKEMILTEARRIAQAHGYNGMNFRELADRVGIKPASIYHHFASKAELGAAVAKRYWEDAAANLDVIRREEQEDPKAALRRYPEVFRRSLESENRLCLGSFMSAEHDDLPEAVMQEVQTFTDVNVAWLSQVLIAANIVDGQEASETRARAIFAAIAGAQLMARSRSDITVFDGLVETYRSTGLLPQ
ncbi:TetR/AcrR family transcriptional regulator [Novosphingobium sp. Leaf2]|uniref:TetR/AcrR family transcriptional regulator n=1 Tax=Novosphingobium sp. Leaf2 TaxID=1735670 RepID=UPI0006F5CC07|nr:TetR/AcrR family transcriptional regulator [Novosphingobium sp. Leaf2]KQM21096.1 transcriptional regulator [Novosphingobium sp. Leaf2]